jgi:hypothetical protein
LLGNSPSSSAPIQRLYRKTLGQSNLGVWESLINRFVRRAHLSETTPLSEIGFQICAQPVEI